MRVVQDLARMAYYPFTAALKPCFTAAGLHTLDRSADASEMDLCGVAHDGVISSHGAFRIGRTHGPFKRIWSMSPEFCSLYIP